MYPVVLHKSIAGQDDLEVVFSTLVTTVQPEGEGERRKVKLVSGIDCSRVPTKKRRRPAIKSNIEAPQVRMTRMRLGSSGETVSEDTEGLRGGDCFAFKQSRRSVHRQRVKPVTSCHSVTNQSLPR